MAIFLMKCCYFATSIVCSKLQFIYYIIIAMFCVTELEIVTSCHLSTCRFAMNYGSNIVMSLYTHMANYK